MNIIHNSLLFNHCVESPRWLYTTGWCNDENTSCIYTYLCHFFVHNTKHLTKHIKPHGIHPILSTCISVHIAQSSQFCLIKSTKHTQKSEGGEASIKYNQSPQRNLQSSDDIHNTYTIILELTMLLLGHSLLISQSIFVEGFPFFSQSTCAQLLASNSPLYGILYTFSLY